MNNFETNIHVDMSAIGSVTATWNAVRAWPCDHCYRKIMDPSWEKTVALICCGKKKKKVAFWKTEISILTSIKTEHYTRLTSRGESIIVQSVKHHKIKSERRCYVLYKQLMEINTKEGEEL